jgi:hypothetical protein
MQISRHWRLNSQRYRLQGVRYATGEVSLQERPLPPQQQQTTQPVKLETQESLKVAS